MDIIAHLLRRAGFDATADEYARYSGLGFKAAVDELVNYDRIPDDFEQQHERDYYGRRDLVTIQNLWLYRMLSTKRPLEEKMTLFWHNLFATANSKVNEPGWMWQQNELFRKNALGNFRTLLTGVAKDPAMLRWLDGDQNRKGKPNENFAREVMELFTLGIGNYSEQDIKEGARALTGWQLNRNGQAMFNPKLFDDGSKTFLGRTGNLKLDDVVDVILKQPAHAQYMARRLFTFFVHENPSKDALNHLAGVYASSNYELRPVVREMFLMPDFSSKAAYRALIKSPIELYVGTLKRLGIGQLPKEVPAIPLLRRLGQEPFNPPSVKGWDGGAAWISTGTMLDRFNFANALARSHGPTSQGWLAQVQALGAKGMTASDLVGHLATTLLQGDLPDAMGQVLADYVQSGAPKQPLQLTPTLVDTKVRSAFHLMLCTPLHQLN